MRYDAEKAREDALLRQQEADRQREEYHQRLVLAEREAEETAALKEARAKLKANDAVRIPRFDNPGRVVRVDHRRNIAVVSLGLGQWEVSLEEVYPLPEA